VITACDSYTWIDGVTYTSSNNTATHTLTNVAGCDSVVTLNLTINAIITTVSQNLNVLTSDEDGAVYQWLNCPELTPIDGAISQSYTAAENGEYAVRISKYGCEANSDCYLIEGLEINEELLPLESIIYPNPTFGQFEIDFGDKLEMAIITIRDLSGKLVYSEIVKGKEVILVDLDSQAGVYYIYIETGEKVEVFSLIKQ
jgi:hypothetical protein